MLTKGLFRILIGFITVLTLLVFPSYGQTDGRKNAVTFKKVEIKEKKSDYSLEICYPQITGKLSPGATAFNQSAKKEVDKLISEFMEDMSKATIDPEYAWQLYITYDVKLNQDGFVCILYRCGYFTGGAHPAPIIFTLNYDLTTGKQIQLKHLFKKDSGWMKTISDYCINQLKNREDTDENWVKDGASPNDYNYQVFYFNPFSLTIVFAPYQVAPYASGLVEVNIPFDKIKKVLDTSGLAGRIMK